MSPKQFWLCRLASWMTAIALVFAVSGGCGSFQAITPVPAAMCRPTLTNADLARRVWVSPDETMDELAHLVHPFDANVVKSACFGNETAPACVDVQYTVQSADSAPDSGDPLCLRSPVRGKIIWLDGTPGYEYNFEIMPDGADYFVWLRIVLQGDESTAGLRLAAGIQAGYSYEQGTALATCFDRADDLYLTMGLARCNDPDAIGTVRCALATGRTYLDPREPQWWAGGLPQYLADRS